MLVYDLGDKYVRFEAEVGFDDRASGGSVYFIALGMDPTATGKALAAQYPAEIAMLAGEFGGIEVWLANGGEAIEKGAVNRLLKNLKDKGYFSNQVKKVNAMKPGE